MSKKQNSNYGIVYLLTNPAMSGLVKIGMTTRDNVDERMRELFNTSVPVAFECEYACKVEIGDCSKIEKALHIAFQPYRIHPQREFFRINPEQARAILELLDKTKDITKEVSAEIDNDLSPIDKKAGEELKRKMRPPLNFKEMGISVGTKLQYVENPAVEVEVYTDRKVLYNSKITSLTAVIKDILHLDYAIQPTRYWLYNGKNLQDIYNETYTLDEE
jgi:hypothetical protein